MHKLLARQLKRHLGSDEVPEALQPLVSAIDEAYHQADADRALLERAMDLASEELLEANEKLREEVRERERLFEEAVEARRLAEEQALELEVQAEALQERSVQLEEAQSELEAANDQLLRINTELEEGAERLRFVMDSMPQKVWSAGPDGTIHFFNQPWSEYSGHTTGELAAAGWFDLVHPDERERVEALWRDSVRRGSDFQVEHRLRRRDGEYCWHLSRGVAQRDERGRARMWVGTSTDIHEQKRTEEELRSLAERLRHLAAAARAERDRVERIFTASPAVMALYTGPEHVISLVNPAWERIVGKPGAVGRPFREVFPEMAETGLYELLDQVYETGEPYANPEFTLPLDRGNTGEPEETSWSFVWLPLPQRPGNDREILVHAVEVTDQVRARRAVEAARAAAEEANRVKAGFLATMSHELRTPLNAMIGYAELLQMGVPDPLSDRALEHVRRIELSARHLLQIIEEILTFSRLEAGREEVDVERVPLRVLLLEVGAIVDPLAREKGLEFLIDRAAPQEAIETDPRKLRQILINLLGNAVKFTDHGQVSLAIETVGDEVRFRVSDTGVGIAAEHLESIFEPFQQVETERAKRAHGTGLGLSVSRRLARLLGGDLAVESRVGVGSTFTLRLPAHGPVAPAEPSPTLDTVG